RRAPDAEGGGRGQALGPRGRWQAPAGTPRRRLRRPRRGDRVPHHGRGRLAAEEITLKKAVIDARARYAAAPNADARKTAMAEIARLEMRLAIAEEARRRFLKY